MSRLPARPLFAVAAAAALVAAAIAAAPPVVLDLRRPASDAPVTALTTIVGGEPLEWGGSRLAGGDINGDGIGDLVMSAPGGTEDRPSRRGRLYVIYGGVAPPPGDLDRTLRRLATPPGAPAAFATQADVVIEGWDDFDHLGRSLAVADVDKDGFADIVAGSPRADGPGNARPDCGEVYVVHGASSLPRVIELSAGPAGGVRVHLVMGRAPGDTLGASLDVGDINGDGAADIVAGAPLSAGTAGALGAVNVGGAFVIGGGPGMPAVIDLAMPPAGAIVCALRGGDPGDQAGSAVASGDFDGDGLADIAVGARGGDGPLNQRPDSGEVYLVFGSKRLPASVTLGFDAAAYIASPDIGDLLGAGLAFGDATGDGRADLAATAETADGAGNTRLDAGDVFLMEGRAREALELLRPAPRPGPGTYDRTPEPSLAGPVPIDLGSPGIAGLSVFHGADPGDHTGARILVDLDRNGRADLILCAEDASSRRNARAGGGECRVIRGAARMPAEVTLSDAAAAMTIYGPVGGSHLGRAAAGVDINGDGRAELIVAAPQSGRSLSGTAWVLSGSWKELLAPPATAPTLP